MCGIAGFLDLHPHRSREDMMAVAVRMAQAIVHRGPDDSGYWVDEACGIGLGHQRLSILDLSPAGHQPMMSSCGRYLIVFNGEIYNHKEIRAELDSSLNDQKATGVVWRGHSDTEVILAACVRWGIEATIKRLVGMFAIAIWDRHERELVLIRDRLGEKPLYYGWRGGSFLFGSELKALRAYPQWEGQIDRGALALLMRLNYVPAPYSIYRGICKLMPGTILRLRTGTREFRSTVYWSLDEIAANSFKAPFSGDRCEAVSLLDSLLTTSVHRQMVADVPLGAFLSGGIDSSTIVALMQKQSNKPVRTFSIGFDNNTYNEAQHAKAVARHLGTDHTEFYVTSREALDVIPCLPEIYDEPFSDSSQIPTVLLSRLARQQVTVSLSGDGGDELFGGYNRYVWGRRMWRIFGPIPMKLRAPFAKGALNLSDERWDGPLERLNSVLPVKFRVARPGEKLAKLAEILGARGPEDIYRIFISHWEHPEEVVLGGKEPPIRLTSVHGWDASQDFAQSMMLHDLDMYLPNDILVKVDRAAMAASLETRIPMLDHHVVEFALGLPPSLNFRGGIGKWPLRQVLYKYVPPELVERPKMGFGVPLASWLRGPLRPWAEALLEPGRLRQEGYFNADLVQTKWNELLAGCRNCQFHLWDVLVFQSWLERQ